MKRVKPAIKTVDKPTVKKVYKSADTGKIVSKKDAEANPKETYAVDAPKPVAKVAALQLGVYSLFTKGDDEFIGIVQTLDPLTIIEHSMANGVHSEVESDVLSLDGWKVEPLSKDEVFSRLY